MTDQREHDRLVLDIVRSSMLVGLERSDPGAYIGVRTTHAKESVTIDGFFDLDAVARHVLDAIVTAGWKRP